MPRWLPIQAGKANRPITKARRTPPSLSMSRHSDPPSKVTAHDATRKAIITPDLEAVMEMLPGRSLPERAAATSMTTKAIRYPL